MIQYKKRLLAVAIFCVCGMAVRGAEIEWTATSGTIPNDGNTYYIIKEIEISSALGNQGILEIRSGGHLSVPSGKSLANTGTLTIKTGGQISCNSGATVENLFDNATFNVSGGIFHLIGGQFKNADFPDYSYVNVTGGLFKMSGGTLINSRGASSTGYFTVSSNGTLDRRLFWQWHRISYHIRSRTICYGRRNPQQRPRNSQHRHFWK
jgi:hypothetical protein